MSVATTYLSKWPASSDTRKTMLGALRQIAKVLGSKDPLSFPWESLRYDVVRGLPARLQESGLSPRTVNKAVVALRGVLEAAWSQGLLPDEDYRRIGRVRGVRGSSLPAGRALSDGDVETLSEGLKKVSPRDAALIVVLYACGLRRVEVARLRREDYDPKEGRLKARGKGGKERSVPLAEEWRGPVDIWWRTLSQRAPMFPRERGGTALTRSGVSYLVERFCREAGVKRFTPHDLRRTFATKVIEGSGDLLATQRLMGHVNVNTTAIYDRRGEEAEREAVKSLKRPKKYKEKKT